MPTGLAKNLRGSALYGQSRIEAVEIDRSLDHLNQHQLREVHRRLARFATQDGHVVRGFFQPVCRHDHFATANFVGAAVSDAIDMHGDIMIGLLAHASDSRNYGYGHRSGDSNYGLFTPKRVVYASQ